jgi:hypothetical protein
MIPDDRILIDGNTGWLIVGPLGPGADVIPGDQAIAEWRAQFDRPCETRRMVDAVCFRFIRLSPSLGW